MILGVVIVTYNRLEKLKKCLAAYEAQEYQPAYVLVVDNGSTDGTKEYLDAWMSAQAGAATQCEVIRNTVNTGGAGGFAQGIKQMAEKDVDWIWIADDDAYPDKSCLRIMADYCNSLSPEMLSKVASLSAKVIGVDGNVSELHRRKIYQSFWQIKERPLRNEHFDNPVSEIDLFSFVGTAVKSDLVRIHGVPNKEYFIFYDDSEYSMRLRPYGKHLCLSEAVIVHDSMEKVIQRYGWKNYYMFRNKLYTYKIYFPIRCMLWELCKTIYMILRYYNCALSWKQFWHALCAIHKDEMGVDVRYLPQFNK